MTSSTALASMPSALSVSTGQRRNVRLRFFDVSALKPVSMIKVRL
jgi:hypothetical protein